MTKGLLDLYFLFLKLLPPTCIQGAGGAGGGGNFKFDTKIVSASLAPYVSNITFSRIDQTCMLLCVN